MVQDSQRFKERNPKNLVLINPQQYKSKKSLNSEDSKNANQKRGLGTNRTKTISNSFIIIVESTIYNYQKSLSSTDWKEKL